MTTGSSFVVKPTELKVKVLREHRTGCQAQMVWLGSTERRDYRGRRHKHAYRTWLKLVCNLNNHDCAALAIVAAYSIEATTEEVVRHG